MKITIEPSDPSGPMGQRYPKISVDTQHDGDYINDVFEAMRGAVVAYGFSEQTFHDHVREYAALLALTDGRDS